jgi:ethanolamine-phosphate cytidylyltransferase
MTTITIPKPGHWPIDPQEDQSIEEDRIWIDGCFDFFHHGMIMLLFIILWSMFTGTFPFPPTPPQAPFNMAFSGSLLILHAGHAGVMLQARQLGTSLLVGIHSDEEILANKGPTVMSLAERVSASAACRWTTLIIPHAPYVTSLDWISHYGCKYVVHGDDITSDAGGEDCYRFVKEAGRFKVVKRTPGISTTDLVGRMLLCTKEHFIKSLKEVAVVGEGKEAEGVVMKDRLKSYASDESGLKPGVDVYMYSASTVPSSAGGAPGEEEQAPIAPTSTTRHRVDTFITGKRPRPDQRIVYVDGGFDLFSSGHIEFLKSVVQIEEAKAKKAGWKKDYSPCYVVAGIHDDEVINDAKGVNYPIMNIYERGLCLLQCRVSLWLVHWNFFR